MKQFLVVLALCATALLGDLAYEVHGLNRRLDSAALIPSRISAGMDRAVDYYTNDKYAAERAAFNKQLQDSMMRDLEAATKPAASKPRVRQ